MSLKHREKFMLILYLEYYDREYSLYDERTISFGLGFLNRHIEMQNICYLVQKFNIYLGEDYRFVWDYLGPKSHSLANDLNKLDRKQNYIEEFYKEYINKRVEWAGNYKQQLRNLLYEYCSDCQANDISLSSYVFNDIFSKENGSVLVASLIYLYKTVYPGAEKQEIFEELEKRFVSYGIQVDKELEEMIWKDASILGLIQIPQKYSVHKRRVLER